MGTSSLFYKEYGVRDFLGIGVCAFDTAEVDKIEKFSVGSETESFRLLSVFILPLQSLGGYLLLFSFSSC